ncbi:MAG: SDR family NAD(P)-dependent oxidoreductase [Sandaracinaceae bacterium]|nr:SDR family NAD(P)-dependent oxidoreductase [Sandaracinaceae bacterium]
MSTASKTYVLTGATSGVGLGVARGLASDGVRLVSLCRDEARGRAAAEGLAGTVDVVSCDLASQASVRRAAAEVLERCPRIDALVSCAGVAPWQRHTTTEGVELVWATNFLGAFLLEHLLEARLIESAPSRVVLIAGDAHRKGVIHWDDVELTKGYGAMPAGTQSVLAKILWTYHLARRLEGTGVTANAFCPGFVRSGLTRDFPWYLRPVIAVGHLFAQSPEQGARTPVWLATSPELEGVTGKYFRFMKELRSSEATYDVAAQDRLVALAQEMTQVDEGA